MFGGAGQDDLTGDTGADQFDVRDDELDDVDCGTAVDVVTADLLDTVTSDCEIVNRAPLIVPDTTRPNTSIKSGPKGSKTARTARFTFSSTEVGSRFQCKLDKKAWASCKSPKPYKKLKKGKHTFQVRAIDKAGNVDASPAKRSWRIRQP